MNTKTQPWVDPITEDERQDIRVSNAPQGLTQKLLSAYDQLLEHARGRETTFHTHVGPVRVPTPVAPAPSLPVEPQQLYRFREGVVTRAGHVHAKDSALVVLRRTMETPHAEIAESGHNWVCLTRFGVSVWATLESCIARDLLELVPPSAADYQTLFTSLAVPLAEPLTEPK